MTPENSDRWDIIAAIPSDSPSYPDFQIQLKRTKKKTKLNWAHIDEEAFWVGPTCDSRPICIMLMILLYNELTSAVLFPLRERLLSRKTNCNTCGISMFGLVRLCVFNNHNFLNSIDMLQFNRQICCTCQTLIVDVVFSFR